MNNIINKLTSRILPLEEANECIRVYDAKKANLGADVKTPSAVCFSLQEINKLLNHAAVGFDDGSIPEEERGIAFYFVINDSALSIMMVMTRLKDNDGDDHYDPTKGDIFDNIIINAGSRVNSKFNLLDVGTKHP